jgi:hypothetical protein
MIGILPDKARELYGIPKGCEVWTGLAIGYKGEPTSLPDRLRERDLASWQRMPLSEFVFGSKWGTVAAGVEAVTPNPRLERYSLSR